MRIYRLETRHGTDIYDHKHQPGARYMDQSRPTPHECGSFEAASQAAGDYFGYQEYVCGVEDLDQLAFWFDMQAMLHSGDSASYQVTTWSSTNYYTCHCPTMHRCAGQVVFHRDTARLLDTMRVGEFVIMHTERHGGWAGYVQSWRY